MDAIKVEIKSAAILEMIISLQGIIAHPDRVPLRPALVAKLGEEFLQEAAEIYQIERYPTPFAELAADYPDRDDVEGFIEYIAAMDDRTFVFYALSRSFPIESIPEKVTSREVEKLFDSGISEVDTPRLHEVYPDLARFDDPGGLRDDLCRLWSRYWEGFFRELVPGLEPLWQRSVEENRRILELRGVRGFARHLTGFADPGRPPMGGRPTRVECFPIVNAFRRTMGFAQDGIELLPYDARISEELLSRVYSYKERSLELLKALGDNNRLRILKTIAHFPEHGLNGTKLAQMMRLSQSVVSRHLTQLKRTGVIIEQTTDNRSYTYSLDLDRLRTFFAELEEFITIGGGPWFPDDYPDGDTPPAP